MKIKFLPRHALVIFTLAQLGSPTDARSKLSPSELYPGPWLEITEEVRQVLVLHRVSACSEAARRQSSRNSGEYLLYCTQDEMHWTSWLIELAADKVRGPGRLLEGIQLPDGY